MLLGRLQRLRQRTCKEVLSPLGFPNFQDGVSFAQHHWPWISVQVFAAFNQLYALRNGLSTVSVRVVAHQPIPWQLENWPQLLLCLQLGPVYIEKM